MVRQKLETRTSCYSILSLPLASPRVECAANGPTAGGTGKYRICTPSASSPFPERRTVKRYLEVCLLGDELGHALGVARHVLLELGCENEAVLQHSFRIIAQQAVR